MAWCLMAWSHYLKLTWIIISIKSFFLWNLQIWHYTDIIQEARSSIKILWMPCEQHFTDIEHSFWNIHCLVLHWFAPDSVLLHPTSNDEWHHLLYNYVIIKMQNLMNLASHEWINQYRHKPSNPCLHWRNCIISVIKIDCNSSLVKVGRAWFIFYNCANFYAA